MRTNWPIFARRTAAIENAHIPRVEKVLARIVRQFASDLTTHGQAAAISALTPINNDLLTALLNIYGIAGMAGARITRLELQPAYKEWNQQQKAGGFGRNEAWLQALKDYLDEHGLEFVIDISDNLRSDLIAFLDRSLEQNLSFDQIARTLSADGFSRPRAQRIVRTEIVRAANVGHQIAAKDTPFEVNKMWVGAADARERPSHIAMNGQTIDEDALFEVPTKGGQEQMNAPGDPEASASNTVNCRCRIVHIPKRDTKGNLIARTTTARIIPMRRPAISNQGLLGAIAAQIKMITPTD